MSAAARADRLSSRLRIEAARAETCAAVRGGACPRCGRPLKRNLSLTGWWQCSQFGALGFRADPEQPSCDWQGFTE